jgi:hypothetical protein
VVFGSKFPGGGFDTRNLTDFRARIWRPILGRADGIYGSAVVVAKCGVTLLKICFRPTRNNEWVKK